MEEDLTLAILSDIHGNVLALESVLADLQARGITRVVNLGDHISGPLWPGETARLLMSLGWPSIAGNHDHNLVRVDPENQGPSDRFAYQAIGPAELAWLRDLPDTLSLDPGLFLFHGTPDSDLTYLLESIANGRTHLAAPAEIAGRLGQTGARFNLCGHTHTPRVVQLPDGRVIINPGSVGMGAYMGEHPEVHLVETGSPHARYAVLRVTDHSSAVELISVSYDHHRAADLAVKNGRPEWEMGLRTGYVR